ncbi:uncharacterized protein LOC115877433 [Sitophilus oryzae]|uniref:Uncharacterized protein LOC115877433 n=1 Tax=Sitophilus oryzae TaxID=7048 RepID=A0A6J2XDN7_SITOR|nr:uncharacterized protein LOC115877433 [Sitophilus oryzae]XP_030749448.1 uncharacterized protein LOC115877433 [Sitophilus oryzae]
MQKENLEQKLAKISEFESNRLKNKYVKRCRSDTLTDSVLPSRRKNRSSEAVISSGRSRNKDKGVLGEVPVDRPSTQRTLNERLRDIEQRRLYGLQKSKSDVIDIQVKSKPSQHVQRPYHRRTGSDDLFQKSWHKYNLKESLKRAERDGYKNFLDTTPYRACSVDRSSDRNRKKPVPGYLETAETVFCNNKPQNFEIKDVEKPKRYRLRQSRAGILVISDESFSSSHRKRCHGDLGDCREDSGDVIIEGDLTSSVEDLNELRKRYGLY